MLEWTIVDPEATGEGSDLHIRLGELVAYVHPKSAELGRTRHMWAVFAGNELVVEGKAQMLNGAKERAVRALLSEVVARQTAKPGRARKTA